MSRLNLLIALGAFLFCDVAAPCAISQTRYTRENPLEQFAQSAFVIHATVNTIEPAADGQYEDLHLAVHAVLKGMENTELTKVRNFLGSDCSQHLEPGREYVIFAFPAGDSFPDRFRLVGMSGSDISSLLLLFQK